MKKPIPKTIIAMSRNVLLGLLTICFLANLVLAEESPGQTMEEVFLRITVQNPSVQELFDTIEAETPFSFFYNKSRIETLPHRITLTQGEQSVADVLRQVSSQTGLKFSQLNATISVRSDEIFEIIEPPVQEEVTGRVTDAETGETLPGVNIQIQGTSQGTTTDLDGEYQINAEPDEVLIFSYVGYESSEIPIEGRNVINISLSQTAVIGEELVVVGYGTQAKRDLTGSVSQISSDDLENQGVAPSVDQMIEGKAAGVQVVQGGGEPGGSASINIRGMGSISAGSSPLYVIDGLPIDNSVIAGTGNQVASDPTPRSPLSSLNPEDIESIEILKDASATAIYGSRGANGVVLITTKQGSEGDLQIDYSGYFAIQNIHNQLDLLNPQEYQREINEIIDSGNSGAWLSSERVDEIQNGGTDWQDEITRDNAPVQKQNLSFSWGDKNTTYYISLNNTNQQGIIKETSYKRYAARFNFNHNTEKLNIGFNLSTSYIEDLFVPLGNDVGRRSGVMYAARRYDPTISVRTADGNFNLPFHTSLDNPMAIVTGHDMEGNRYRYFGKIFGEYFILPDKLSLKLNVGADVDNQDKSIYKDRTTIIGGDLGGVASLYNRSQSTYLIEGFANYNDQISEDHRISLVGGITTQKFYNSGSNMQAQGFPTDATRANEFGSADPESYLVNSSKNIYSLLSYFARINYTLKDKYLFTGTFRIDGSSRFGEGNRFGYFPSFSIGWLLNEEEFFPFQEAFSEFKLRGSWGQTGNQQIGNNQSILTFGTGPNYVLNDQLVTTLQPSRIANPDLKWETTEQIDVGLDFSLFGDRISGSVDWYKKDTYDMLLNLPIPTSTGFSSQRVNIGGMINKGIEVTLSSHNISNRKFSWQSDINLTKMKNEITSLGEIPQSIDSNSINKPGLPFRSFYGYDVIGIWQQDEVQEAAGYGLEPGDFKFRDVNSDGIIDGEDRVVLGDSFPNIVGSFSNTFNYGLFQLYFSIQGVNGVKMWNRSLSETYFVRGRNNRSAEPFINRWTPDNPTNKYPSFLDPGKQQGQDVNSKTVEDASYLKLQTVKLSYTLPNRVLNNFARSAKIYVTGQNLLTLTGYTGFDPAISPGGDVYHRVDWNAYPSATTFLLGVNIGF